MFFLLFVVPYLSFFQPTFLSLSRSLHSIEWRNCLLNSTMGINLLWCNKLWLPRKIAQFNFGSSLFERIAHIFQQLHYYELYVLILAAQIPFDLIFERIYIPFKYLNKKRNGKRRNGRKNGPTIICNQFNIFGNLSFLRALQYQRLSFAKRKENDTKIPFKIQIDSNQINLIRFHHAFHLHPFLTLNDTHFNFSLNIFFFSFYLCLFSGKII